ncbi:LytR/AlgR family response regulator transcription factor [Pseudoduganella namucuonensis]|uniref:Two component transcriptional regulator, LytTR family n=1 Tax=Pseudoduganella namucuonensis TaxID=1035707 RepID=A0A1I7L5E0_9BURK|nr:LytTR family DNA-binding domain-containing protein [Pseudoduganella namucuonensis]SFV04724.1 two component transcriptional regulator, LytTR family [Pseudoduganella namucuonensis]
MILTAVIADDEPFALAGLADALVLVWPELQVVATACDGPSAFQAIRTHRPTLAFLDIRMPGMSGLQVAEAVGEQTLVVIVSAYDHYAMSAFEKGVADYVLKPVELPRLVTVVRRLQERMAQVSTAKARPDPAPAVDVQPAAALQWIKASVGTLVRLIHVDDVYYFESDAKYTRVVTADGEALIRMPLKQLAGQLDPQWFWQVHRSSVVNLRHVVSAVRIDENMEVILKDRPERIKVSLQYQALFRQM